MFSDNNLAKWAASCVLMGAPFWCDAQIDSTASIDTTVLDRAALTLPNYSLPQVDITAARLDLVNALDPHQIEINQHATTEEATWVIRHLPGSFSRGNGGPGSLQTISVGGGTATHVAILLDGIPLNSPQFGSLDLSTVPISSIGRIDYLPHGGTSVGAGSALSGALNLVPKIISPFVRVAAGPYGRFEQEAGIVNSGRKLGLSMGRQSYEGNFPYDDHGVTNIRENNRSRADNFRATFEGQVGRTQLNAAYWMAETFRLLPGSITQSTPHATQEDFWSLASLGGDRLGDDSRHRWKVYHQQQNYIYDSPNSIPAIVGKHDLTIIGAHYTLRKLWKESLASLSKIELRREYLTSTNTDSLARLPWSALQRMEISPQRNLDLLMTARVSGIGKISPWLSGEITLTLRMPSIEVIEKLSLISSTNLHHPTFNDLYWQPGGNPDLLPERSTMVGGRIDLQNNPTTLRVEYYHTRYDDLIIWSPDAGGSYSPDNLQSAMTSDLIGTLNMKLPSIRTTLSGSATLHHSEDLSQSANHGKMLRYNPEGIGQLTVTREFQHDLSWTIQGGGQTEYITYYNPPDDRPEEAFWSWNSHLRWSPAKTFSVASSIFSPSINFAVMNAGDHNITTNPGYPEPGRTWLITLELRKQ